MNTKGIYIINGMGGVGKDEFVKHVSKYIPTMNYSSVSFVKQIAKECGWTGAKTENDRKFLSDLKILLSEYNDIPFKRMQTVVDSFNVSKDKILFLHIREPLEIARAVEEFGAKTILIKRDSIAKITSNMADAGVFNYNYDFIIENNEDIDYLDTLAKNFVTDMFGKA
jgi:hypothetical protein